MNAGKMMIASLGLMTAAGFCSGCYNHLEPGEEGCELDASQLPDDVVVRYRVVEGFSGDLSTSSVREDGTVIFDPGDSGDLCETTLADGEAGVQRLLTELEDDGLFDEDDGCYEPNQDVMDGGSASLFVRRGGSLRRFRSSASAGPDELLEAFTTLDAHLDEPRQLCD